MAIRSKLLLDTVVPYCLIGKSIMRSIRPRWTFSCHHELSFTTKQKCVLAKVDAVAALKKSEASFCNCCNCRSLAEDSKHRETKLRTDEALDLLHFICKELSSKFTQNSHLFLSPGWTSPVIWFYNLVLFITKLVSILWEEFDI